MCECLVMDTTIQPGRTDGLRTVGRVGRLQSKLFRHTTVPLMGRV